MPTTQPLHILASPRPVELETFTDELVRLGGARVLHAPSAARALELAAAHAPELVVIDENLPGMGALELAGALLRVNAMINTAVVSTLEEEEFHEASEGLGILMPLAPTPGPEDAAALVRALRAVTGPLA
jgi:CheY-like chemotaxis protein